MALGTTRAAVTVLWDPVKSDEVFTRAVAAMDEAASGKFSRDVIRTLPFTERVMKACGVTKPGPPNPHVVSSAS